MTPPPDAVGSPSSTVHWIIGTAGHIDHGKTSLVRALTGQDTDRLKEEKERGISIDLGFAHLDLPGGRRAGVVDVPGHERFIRNMLAGAHGMDLVLFTVAADDGVMPQTEEHLDILHLLGVSRAVFVLTKVDRVPAHRAIEVADQIRSLTRGTSLEGAPIVRFSAVTEEGLDELRERIASALQAGLRPRHDGYFRLPVDRVFVSAGHGLIVTGTAIDGEVRPGDTVRAVPGGDVLRVRSVEVHNDPVETATCGQRIALNLTGTSRAEVSRGSVICHERIALVTSRFDARIEIRPRAPAGVKDHQRIRVHLGTAERLATAIPLTSKPGTPTIVPGETGYCQIVLAEPIHALRGDRFIIRDETARRTLGGGVVLHPLAPKRKRGDGPELEVLDRADESAVARALIAGSGEFAVSLATLVQLMNRREEGLRARLQSASEIHAFAAGDDIEYALEDACRQVKTTLVDRLRAWHAAHPLLSGMSLEEARVDVPPKLFRMLVDELAVAGAIVREGSVIRLPAHRIEVPEEDRALVAKIKARLDDNPLTPPDVKQLADDLGADRNRLLKLLRVMEKQRAVVGVTPEMYFSGDAVARVRDELVRWLSEKGSMTAAEFRDRYHTSRKYAIPLLEYFDREAVTMRMGEVRRLRQTRKTETA